MITDLEFAQYTSAKICHDLAGALGAIANGIEFIASEDPEMKKKALELINISAHQAIDTMKLFRQMYGSVKYPGKATIEQMKESCQLVINDKRVNLEFLIPFSLPSERVPNVDTTQLMLALVSLAKSQLIHGGSVSVMIHPYKDHNSINIVASGRDMKIKYDSHQILNGKLDNYTISSSNIDAYYISRLRENLKCPLEISEGHDKIEYIIPYYS